ncbi:MAG: IclR family transcriptional regulator [Armatimonadota bacterium]|nr:IclR family transcriptional regulator [Armatimonadota bacterium]
MARPRTQDTEDVLKGVERAVALLNLFSIERPTLDLPGASRVLGIPRSTAYRLLRSLEAGHLLVYNERERSYRLGLAVARLGQVALASVDLRAAARPYLRGLVEETGESSFLLVVEGNAAVVIDTQETGEPLKLTRPVGTPWPLHAGASNKVLLAHLPDDAQAEYLRRPLARITPRTTTDPRRLARELARIRRRGYGVTTGELTPGVVGVAVPILSGGRLLGALAVAGPVSRLSNARIPRIVARLRAAAAGIVRDLEGTGTHTTSRRWLA